MPREHALLGILVRSISMKRLSSRTLSARAGRLRRAVRASVLSAVPLLFAATLSAACAKVGAGPSHSEVAAAPAPTTAPAVTVAPALKALSPDASIADVAERVLPSVVNISLTKPGKPASFQGSPFP